MKLNGLSRIFIPISLNTALIAIIKKVYDMHNIIDRIMGDKLLHQQYMFMYDKIQFVNNSREKKLKCTQSPLSRIYSLCIFFTNLCVTVRKSYQK